MSSPAPIRFTIPVTLANLANTRMHPLKRARVVKKLREAARLCATSATRSDQRRLPADVTLARMCRNKGRGCGQMMDDDNLVAALKPIRDGIADAFGAKNDNAGWTWRYDQSLSDEDGVFVQIVVADFAANGA